ncbi:MAG: NAD-dependent epimerase/dehydratase family protein [Deltaproteobacteria bacterium]
MKALVTGGGGFLGKNLTKHLLERGDEVRIFARSKYPEVEAMGAEAVQGDVTDRAAVDAAVAGVDIVFHTASRIGYWGDYAEYESINVGGTTNIVEACRAAGVERLVYTSTPSVVIGADGVDAGSDETVAYPDAYLSSYGPTKAQAEKLALAASDASFRVAALRPHFIFGPGDPHIAPRLVENAKKGTIAQVGDGSNRVDVAYIDNVVSAHVKLGDALADPTTPCGGQAYFLGDAEPVKLWDFVGRVLEGMKAPPVKKNVSFKMAWRIGATLEFFYRTFGVEKEPPLTRMAAVMLGTSHYFSHAKAARDFGYAPLVTTDEGLERLFAADAPR